MRLKGAEDKEFCCHASANDHRHFCNNVSTYLSSGHVFVLLCAHSSHFSLLLARSVHYCGTILFVYLSECVCVCMGRCTPQYVLLYCICVPADLSYSAPVMVSELRWDLFKYVFKTTPPAPHITAP